jgi:rubredoxin
MVNGRDDSAQVRQLRGTGGIMKKSRIPPMLVDLVQMTLASCDGVVFGDAVTCPHCGGETGGYDMKRKQFAVLREGETERVISVQVRRFRCRNCGYITFAGQPFYPGTRIGSPVVDLCITLGETMPYTRVSSFLARIGLVVDRWSVRNYVKGNRPVPAADMFGVRVPLTLVSLSTLAGSVPEGGRMDPRAMLAACGHPSGKKS